MSAYQIAHLTSRSVLSVEGPEAKEFLQGLITNDMNQVTEEAAIYAALLTPQGKILFEFHVVRTGDEHFLLDIAAHNAAALHKRLTMYKLRAAVTLTARPDLHVLALFPSYSGAVPTPEAEASYKDSRNADLGFRVIASTTEGTTATENEYHTYRRSLGIPEGTEIGEDNTFLLEANFEELNGVDFKKGCYVGQELAARMKHKTTLRKRLLPYSVTGAEHDSARSITAGASEIGQVIDRYANGGFALIRLDRMNAAQEKGDRCVLGETPIVINIPEWLQSTLEEVSGS